MRSFCFSNSRMILATAGRFMRRFMAPMALVAPAIASPIACVDLSVCGRTGQGKGGRGGLAGVASDGIAAVGAGQVVGSWGDIGKTVLGSASAASDLPRTHRYPQRHRLQLALELEELVDGVAVAHQRLGHHLDRVLL